MRIVEEIGDSAIAVNAKLDGDGGRMACSPMLEVEATRLCEVLSQQDDISPLLNLGSSTGDFREVVKPHIDERLFGPLRRAGVCVVHSDVKAGEGIDVVGDVLDPVVRAALKAKHFRCVLAANILEHVRDRAAVISACEDIVGPGGLVLVTVPSSYQYHADPLDTGYRPLPGELAAAFTRSRALLSEEVTGPTFAQSVAQRGSSLWLEAMRTLLWCLAFPVRPKSAIARLDRWRWLHRPYRVSIALLAVDPTRES